MFNWNSIDRYYLINYILEIQEKIIKNDITIEKFHRILSNHIKKLLPLKFKKIYDPTIKTNNNIKIGGCYFYNLDKNNKKAIQITIHYSAIKNNVELTSKKLYNIAYCIANILMHEIIHMKQFRSRNFKLIKNYISKSNEELLRLDQEYYGHNDEIDAWAFVIACELYDNIGHYNKIIHIVTKLKHSTKNSDTFSEYLKIFKNDINVINRLKKKIISYIPAANRGKPFRYSSFIEN